jgi:hypothetical protein
MQQQPGGKSRIERAPSSRRSRCIRQSICRAAVKAYPTPYSQLAGRCGHLSSNVHADHPPIRQGVHGDLPAQHPASAAHLQDALAWHWRQDLQQRPIHRHLIGQQGARLQKCGHPGRFRLALPRRVGPTVCRPAHSFATSRMPSSASSTSGGSSAPADPSLVSLRLGSPLAQRLPEQIGARPIRPPAR